MTCTCHAAGCDMRHPDRRAVLAGLVCTAVLPAVAIAAPVATPPADDERFMRIAIEEAKRADFPFGAVIVRDGKILARGRNLGKKNNDPTAHGEMVAIRRGLASHGSKGLRGATIYTSGEPCAMCMGAILWCHFGRLVFAASIEQLVTKIDQIMISSEDLAARTKFAPIDIRGGVLADEAMKLFDR